MKRIIWWLIMVGLLMACTTSDGQTTLPESFANWHLPQPPDGHDKRVPLVWLGPDGAEAVWGTGSSFTIASKDPNEPSVSGMPASPAEMRDELATANLAAEATAVVIISDEMGAIQSVAASVQPWADVTSDNFALFAGREVPGSGQQEGDIFAYTLEPLETADDMLLVVSVVFDNSRASGDIVVIWRLNPGASAASEHPVIISGSRPGLGPSPEATRWSA